MEYDKELANAAEIALRKRIEEVRNYLALECNASVEYTRVRFDTEGRAGARWIVQSESYGPETKGSILEEVAAAHVRKHRIDKNVKDMPLISYG